MSSLIDTIDTIPPTATAVAALGPWPAVEPVQPATVKTAAPSQPPARVWRPGMCENRALIYKANPKAFRGQELDRIEPCFEPATADRWVCRGTDRAEHVHYCQRHADKAAAWDATARARIDAAFAARGQALPEYYLWDRVDTPDGPGTVVFLPSPFDPDTYFVGLDSRRKGDRSREYLPEQLVARTDEA